MTTSAPDAGDFLEEHVWPNLDAAESGLLSDLHPKRSSNSWKLTCPQCEKERAYYYKGSSIRCNRIESCGYVSSVWTYLIDYKNLPKKDVFRMVCDAAGVNPPESSRSHGKPSVELKIRKILEYAFETNIETIQKRWCYTEDQMMLLRRYCGFYPSEEYILSKLNEIEQRIARKKGWIKKALAGRLIGFWRQPSGNLGFWARHVSSDEKPKYLFQYQMVKSAPYLLEECAPGKPLIAVEGGRDVLALKMLGFKNCIGTGGTNLMHSQARVIAERHDKVIYIVDGDIAGMKGIVKTVSNAGAFGINVEFVIIPADSGLDADDFRRNGDISGLQVLWNKRVGSGSALALAYIELLNANTQSALVSEILTARAGLPPRQKSNFRRTLQQFGIELNIEGDACRDYSLLIDHFGHDETNEIISRRFGLKIEFTRAVPNV